MKTVIALATLVLAPPVTIKPAELNSTCKLLIEVDSAFLPNRAITLYPAIVIPNPALNKSADIVRHENVHCDQVMKHGWLPFYSSYLYYYFENRSKGMEHNMAYLAIPFEIEAREVEADEN